MIYPFAGSRGRGGAWAEVSNRAAMACVSSLRSPATAGERKRRSERSVGSGDRFRDELHRGGRVPGGRSPEVIEIDGERRVPSVILIDQSGDTRRRTCRRGDGPVASRPSAAHTEVPARHTDLGGARRPAVLHHRSRRRAPALRLLRSGHVAGWTADRGAFDLPRVVECTAARRAPHRGNHRRTPEPDAGPRARRPAISYTDDAGLEPGAHVLVYDLGGGTFDTAALRADSPGFVVIGRPTGDANPRRRALRRARDQPLGRTTRPATWDKLQVSDETLWQLAAAGLRNESRRAKEVLSSHPEADVLLGLPTGIMNARITRTDLETLIRPYIHESIEVMRRCATDAGLRAEDLDAVYLVGGASRSPIVREMVGAVFPQAQLSRRGDPKSAVALRRDPSGDRFPSARASHHAPGPHHDRTRAADRTARECGRARSSNHPSPPPQVRSSNRRQPRRRAHRRQPRRRAHRHHPRRRYLRRHRHRPRSAIGCRSCKRGPAGTNRTKLALIGRGVVAVSRRRSRSSW